MLSNVEALFGDHRGAPFEGPPSGWWSFHMECWVK